jgi:hypothetical protein
MNNKIKDTVMANPLLQYVLSQIDTPLERERTIAAITGMLEELQGKADGLLKSYNESNKKEDKK